MRRGALLLLATALVLLAPRPAAASCAAAVEPVRLTSSPVVLAGEVLRTTDGGRAAEVRVHDVWRGPDLPPEVLVVGGALGRGAASSTDRTYRAGEQYAFFLRLDEHGVLRDDACTATALLADRAALDPPGVRPPVPSAPAPADPRSSAWPWWLAGGGALVAVAWGLHLWSAARLVGGEPPVSRRAAPG